MKTVESSAIMVFPALDLDLIDHPFRGVSLGGIAFGGHAKRRARLPDLGPAEDHRVHASTRRAARGGILTAR